jgi:ribosomal protein L37E
MTLAPYYRRKETNLPRCQRCGEPIFDFKGNAKDRKYCRPCGHIVQYEKAREYKRKIKAKEAEP